MNHDRTMPFKTDKSSSTRDAKEKISSSSSRTESKRHTDRVRFFLRSSLFSKFKVKCIKFVKKFLLCEPDWKAGDHKRNSFSHGVLNLHLNDATSIEFTKRKKSPKWKLNCDESVPRDWGRVVAGGACLAKKNQRAMTNLPSTFEYDNL